MPMARPAAVTAASARPPRASVPAFGGWDLAGGAAGAEAPDYSLDFTKIRVARMQRRKTLSWSSFVVGDAAVAVETTTPPGGGGGEDEKRRQWSSAAASDGDDDDDDRERRRSHHRLRRLRSDVDDHQPIQPGRSTPKGRSKFKGYLFGCVSGQW